MKILVVEDMPDTRNSLRVLLMCWGHEVIAVEDGVQGLKAFAEHRPDAIVSDIGVPNMNGWDMASAIRALPGGQNVYMIAMTAIDDDVSRQRSYEVGFAHHLVKPEGIERLERLLKAANAARSAA